MDTKAQAAINTLVRVPAGASRRSGNALSAGNRNSIPPLWFAIAATLTFLALLLSFDHVVREGVKTAELRRQNAAAQDAAVWRCQAQPLHEDRADCLARIPGGVPQAYGAQGGLTTTAYASF